MTRIATVLILVLAAAAAGQQYKVVDEVFAEEKQTHFRLYRMPATLDVADRAVATSRWNPLLDSTCTARVDVCLHYRTNPSGERLPDSLYAVRVYVVEYDDPPRDWLVERGYDPDKPPRLPVWIHKYLASETVGHALTAPPLDSLWVASTFAQAETFRRDSLATAKAREAAAVDAARAAEAARLAVPSR